MTKISTFLIVLVFMAFSLHAQKKSELIAKISELETTISELNDSVSVANRQINASNTRAEVLTKENLDLKDANATLLQNLTSFSKISKQNTASVNSALTSLKKKEDQLKVITDTFSKNDSLAIVTFTQIRQSLGAEAKMGVSNGVVVISNSLAELFGSDSESELSEAGIAWVAKIAEVIKTYSNRAITVEGLNITGEFEITLNQTSAIVNELIKTDGLQPEKINMVVKDGNFKEGINIKIGPDHGEFYEMVKKEFK